MLAGALGGIGALVASAVVRPDRSHAADGNPVIIGAENNSGTLTTLTNLTAGGDTFLASTGVFGGRALTGDAVDGVGVHGTASHGSGIGVEGIGPGQGIGVRGAANGGGTGMSAASNTGTGLRALSNGGVGVHATSSSGVAISAKSSSGVAISAESSSRQGIVGKGVIGVEGISNNQFAWGVGGNNTADGGTGVWANAQGTGSRGVSAHSTGGVGVYAQATTGLALQTSGRAKFSTSGVATITAGTTSKTITPGVNVTSGSFVLLTPKVNIGSRALWFTTNASTNKFTIRMSSSRSSETKIAWLLLG